MSGIFAGVADLTLDPSWALIHNGEDFTSRIRHCCIIGIDYGSSKTGLALTRCDGGPCVALKTCPTSDLIQEISRILEARVPEGQRAGAFPPDREPLEGQAAADFFAQNNHSKACVLFVLGFPFEWEESQISVDILQFSQLLFREFGVPVLLYDEGQSSAAIKSALKSLYGKVRKKHFRSYDKYSAMLILQNFLRQLAH